MSIIELIAAALFALALIHSFSTGYFQRLEQRHPKHAGLFHLLGEVELVFGFWSVLLIAAMAWLEGSAKAIGYAESRQYTEPLFVFVIMVIAASRPVVSNIEALIASIASRLPLRAALAQVWLCLALLPLIGSLITEPAAMTLAALMLAPLVFRPGIPERLKYGALGVLFVNISIGGTLTAFAAPPVLMVAASWNWDNAFMASQFGWKAMIAVLINATAITFMLRQHLHDADAALAALAAPAAPALPVPRLLSLIHFALLAGVILFAHHPVIFIGLFLLFLGIAQAYASHQNKLVLKEALLVGLFLGGLLLLGGMQQWWLQPIVAGLEPAALFFGALGLTAFTDNAALTYLGSLIEGISDPAKYMLVAGAVAGGGMTVIANAPNPAGVALLKQGFPDASISAAALAVGAALPTVVAAAVFWLPGLP